MKRSYRVVSPAHPRGLVLLLHGFGGNAAHFAAATGFDREAQRVGLLAVYPEGHDHAWNAGFCCPRWQPQPVDDVALLIALIDRFELRGQAVFVAGFSNGGEMTYRLACQLPQRLTAVAAVAADSEECSPAGRLPPILHIQGTDDPVTRAVVWGKRDGSWALVEPSAPERWIRLGAQVTLVTVPGGGHTWFRRDPDASRTVADFLAARL